MQAIDLTPLNYNFQSKPLLIGGKAMEYYGIRESHNDIDFVVASIDHEALMQQHPDSLKDLFGDIGVILPPFEIWNTICTFDYDYLKQDATEEDAYLVISLEKLLFLKALARDDPKCQADLKLIVDHVLKVAYSK